jgi:hypothetical protein
VRPRSETRAWLALHASSRLQWTLGEFSVLELEGGIGAPLVRDDFVVDRDYFLYRPPAIVAHVRVGMLVRFP